MPTIAMARAMAGTSPLPIASKNAIMPCQASGRIRPTMPKSMNPTRPSSSSIRLPACTSAWKKSHTIRLENQVFSAVIRVPAGSSV